MNSSSRRSMLPVSVPHDIGRERSGWTLLITTGSLELQQKLVSIAGPRPTIILGLDELSDSETLRSSTLDLLADTIRNREVRAIVVCGQTADVAVPARSVRCDQGEESSSFSRMLRRMRDCMVRQTRAQNRMRSQLNQIRSHARIACASRSPAIGLFGILHVAESNLFFVYDQAENQFVPLAETTI